MDSNLIITIVYIAIALTWSFYVAWHSYRIFTGLKKADIKGFPRPKRVQSFVFNFLGLLTGWVALWLILPKPIITTFTHFQHLTVPEFSVSGILLFFLFFIGITGYLPLTIVGIIQAIGTLVEKVLEKLTPGD